MHRKEDEFNFLSDNGSLKYKVPQNIKVLPFGGK